MCCKMAMFLTILIVVLSVLLCLVPSASGFCCKGTTIIYRIARNSKKTCDSFGGINEDIKKKTCRAHLCGTLHRPTPCCARRKPCNWFCCNCDDECWYRNDFVVNDFGNTYMTQLTILSSIKNKNY